MSEVLLELSGIHLAFAGNTVLENVDFTVAKNAVVSLIGPNGAGKTTTPVSYTHLTLPTTERV